MSAHGASLIVVSWNSAGELGPLLESIRAHLGSAPEVIVVDNASTDGSTEAVREADDRARLIELSENLGYGAACNVGVDAASREVVAILNPDTLLIDASLAELLELARSTPAIYGPRLLNEDRTPQISAFAPVASWELAALVAWPRPLMPRAIQAQCEPWRSTARVSAGWLSGACLVANRQLLASLGPFDERLHLYGEDIDLCLRAQRSRIETVFAPDVAWIIHFGHRSAVGRFDDLGQRTKIATRAWVVRENRGAPRAALDWTMQLGICLTRLIAKALLRADNEFERTYLRAALARPLAFHRAGQSSAPLRA